MHNESGPVSWFKRVGALILVTTFVVGLGACGPTTQTTKPDDSSDSQEGYGGYGY